MMRFEDADLRSMALVVAEMQRHVFMDMPEQVWGDSFWSSLAGDSTVLCLLATEAAPDGTEPVGFLAMRYLEQEAEVLTLGVIPTLRRRGVAHGLMETALERMVLRGARTVFLEVAANNDAALTLYRGLGFVVVGRRPRYYRQTSGARVDGLVMRRTNPDLSGLSHQ